MGPNASQLEKELAVDQFPINEHFIGLVNFGNTCYCNSVLQALYYCKPFRDMVLLYKQQTKNQKKETLLTCLADLFYTIAMQKRKTGSIAPKKFIQRLRKENGDGTRKQFESPAKNKFVLVTSVSDSTQKQLGFLTKNRIISETLVSDGTLKQFRKPNREKILYVTPVVSFDNYMQHDAHEFLNYLLNTVADLLQAEKQQSKAKTPTSVQLNGSSSTESATTGSSPKFEPTWIHQIFQGTFTSETRCLNCETVRSKEEDFLDLSVEVEQNTSITHCLQAFSNTETLCSECKYHCEVCCSKQEAQKRMRVKKLPHVLALHLKRFKLEQPNRSIKLSYRVVFPLELRLFNTSDDACNPDRMYDLISVVIHCGSGLSRGHYISIVKSHGMWVLFDDDIVDKIEASAIEDFYGLASDIQKTSESGYILFYQSRE